MKFQFQKVSLESTGDPHHLINQLSITVKKAETDNVKKFLVSKFRWVESIFQSDPAILEFIRQKCGSPTHRLIIRQNPEQLNILLAIGFNRVLVVAVWEDKFNAKKYGHFLKHDLLLPMNRYPAMKSVVVCDNTGIHRSPKVQHLCDKAGVFLIYLPASQNPAWEVRSTFTNVVFPQMLYNMYQHCGHAVHPCTS
ncbi:hypothetical protein VP01_986g5 [Puccinia sorghi]|uniref:Tc1-like transposase DDE domain-containing protein n=1 Tax=Puccinia sorghi TaxID=27349 RepID=A0A0L6U5I8_9BASI|nr:hypothetical protein VP01_986g5 [Puccinia sorghi]